MYIYIYITMSGQHTYIHTLRHIYIHVKDHSRKGLCKLKERRLKESSRKAEGKL